MNNQDNKPAQKATENPSMALKEAISFNRQQIVEVGQNDKTHAERGFREFIHLIELSHREQHSPKFYADKLNMTKSNLRKICQLIIGASPSHCLYTRLMLEGCRLLEGPKAIKEIAIELGFGDPAHFSKFFKSQSGLPPIAYRKFLLKSS